MMCSQDSGAALYEKAFNHRGTENTEGITIGAK